MTREEAIKKAINIVAYCEAHFAKSKESREDAANIIEALEQELKTGHWIEGGFDFNYWICSKCKYQPNNDYYKPSYNYCPNCGAKMEESEDKE